jgi:hypothetical protein
MRENRQNVCLKFKNYSEFWENLLSSGFILQSSWGRSGIQILTSTYFVSEIHKFECLTNLLVI